MTLKNDILLKAARGEHTPRTPVWIMRQAGRVLPEYRAVRKQLSGFKQLVETPEKAAEVTILPVDIFDVDAAIIFSDILVVPQAMGLPYELIENKGPYFHSTVKSMYDIKKLKVADPALMNYVYEAIVIAKKELDYRVPLIGFAGAPWTLFAYMIEGEGSKTFAKARKMLYTHPTEAHQLMNMITDTVIAHLKAQITAGADIIQIFDTWAGLLPHSHYLEFSLHYIAKICNAIHEAPIIVFAKGAGATLKEMNLLNCHVIGLDWNMEPQTARDSIPQKTLQGNLDPCVLYGSFKTIEKETIQMLTKFKGKPHIANLGHGLYPDSKPEKVKHFVKMVKRHSSQ